MKIKNTLIILLLFLLTTSFAKAEDIDQSLTAKISPQTGPQQSVNQTQQTNLDNSYLGSIYDDTLAPVFKPYEAGKNEVVFSYTKNLINAIDPTAYTNKTGSYLPGARGINQLVIYTPNYGPRTNTNEFGAEAIVEGNTVTELSGADSLIPPNGIVISGHGRAKTWMNSSIKIGTKIYIDRASNLIYTYTTSESYIFESEKKISEAEQMLQYYRSLSPDYNWRIPTSYINDAKDYLKKARKNPDEVKKYSQLAIEASNDALKSVVPYKNGELKGVWIRPTETSEEEIEKTLNRLKHAGIDNIFLETYFHGKTIFPSKTMEAYGFTPQYEKFVGIDPLEIWIREAHKRNIKVHTWFETFYVGPQNPKDNPKSILAMNPSWGNKIKKDIDSVDPSKSTSEHNGYFLDPANPYVQDFVVKLADEIITRYKPDGINLDYIRYPNCVSLNENSNWGYTDYARNDFQTIYGVDPADILKTDPLWLEWNNYRREQVTNVVKKIGEMGKKSNTYISAVIFPDRLAALDHKQQDWRTWTTRGYINGLTPLFLTCDSKTANKMMSDVINAKSGNTDFYAGLFVTFMGGTDEDLIRLIHEARKVNAKGVILFDYAHLNNKYINTLSKSVFAQRSPIRKPLYQPEPQKQPQKQDTKGWWIFKKES
uniref:glycoside hydrolase family 10 protein n=1 Tax=Candidatus Stercorousia sp. TaxID=3048886 RepID=UPI004028BD3E